MDDLRKTGSSRSICIIVGQRLGYKAVDYPWQKIWIYQYASRLADLVDITAVSHPRSFDD